MLYAFLLLGLIPMALLPDGSEAIEETDTADNIPDVPDNDSDDLLDDVILDPSDDADDDADTEIDESEDALSPVDEDDVADSSGEDPAPEDILPPSIEDDEPTPPDGDEDEILDPIEEDDTSENETNAAILPVAVPVAEVTEIADFDPDKDVLCIYINDLSDISEEDVVVQLSENSEDSEVYVKEELAAILKNVPNATASNIYLTQMLKAA